LVTQSSFGAPAGNARFVIPKEQIADCDALLEIFQWNLHSPGGIMGVFGTRRDIFNYMQPPKRSTAERLNARLVDQRHPVEFTLRFVSGSCRGFRLR
jgi:hypothetical protein